MIKKYALHILTVLALGIVALYLYPTQQKSFAEYYNGEKEIQRTLEEFRQEPQQKLSVAGTEWKYVSTGQGDTTLLFIHGMGGASDIWFQQILALRSDYQIISVSIPNIHTLTEAVAGIREILAHEEISQVTIIGSSMGGYIAQYILSRHPDIVHKAVLGNTFPPNEYYQEKNGGLRKIVPYLPEWILMSQFRKNAEATVFPPSENSPLLRAYLLEQYSGLMSKEEFIGRFDIVLESYKVHRSAETRSVPKLIIESDNDPLVTPKLRSLLRETYPEAEVYTFRGKGHFPYLNQPEEYTDVLRDFLGR